MTAWDMQRLSKVAPANALQEQDLQEWWPISKERISRTTGATLAPFWSVPSQMAPDMSATVPVNKTWTTWGWEENYWLQGLCVWSASCSFPAPSKNSSSRKSQELELWSAKGRHSKREVWENSPPSEDSGHISTLFALPRAKLPSLAIILLF